MSPGLMKMWISLSAMGFMFLAVFLIYLSRYTFKNKVFKITTAVFAYAFMFLSGVLMFAVVMGEAA